VTAVAFRNNKLGAIQSGMSKFLEIFFIRDGQAGTAEIEIQPMDSKRSWDILMFLPSAMA
jgi:hypothetical protein